MIKWSEDKEGGIESVKSELNQPDGLMVSHVDDLAFAGQEVFHKNFIEKLKDIFPVGLTESGLEGFKYAGVVVRQNQNLEIRIDQKDYIGSVTEVKIDRGLEGAKVLGFKQQAGYRSLLGAIQWIASRSRPDVAYRASRMASYSGKATAQNMRDLNKVARNVFGSNNMTIKFRRFNENANLRLLLISDGNLAREKDEKSQGGFWILLAEDKDSNVEEIKVSILSWRSWKLKRIAVSSLCAETQALHVAIDAVLGVQELIKMMHGVKLEIDCRTDCEALYNAITKSNATEMQRTRVQIASIKEDVENKNLRSVKHICGKTNPADVFTKDNDKKILAISLKMMHEGLLKDCS